jgi:hypothetical protein
MKEHCSFCNTVISSRFRFTDVAYDNDDKEGDDAMDIDEDALDEDNVLVQYQTDHRLCRKPTWHDYQLVLPKHCSRVIRSTT